MLTDAPAPPSRCARPDAARPVAARRRTGTVLAAAVAALLLGACTVSGGSAGAAAPQEDDPAVPAPSTPAEITPADGAALTPLPEVPRDTRPVGTDVFSLQAPAAFTQSTRPGPGGVDMLVLSGVAEEPGSVAEVVAFSAPSADVDLEAEVDVLLTSLREVRRARDISSSSVEWPGAETALVVSWTQDSAVAGGTVTESFVQLTVRAEDGTSATALAVAPAEDLEGSGVVETLRTFRLEGV